MATESEDDERRRRVHKRLDDGALPVEISERVFAGYGLGNNACSGCSEPIKHDEVEYEVRIPARRPLYFHLKCHVVWQAECVRRMKDQLADA